MANRQESAQIRKPTECDTEDGVLYQRLAERKLFFSLEFPPPRNTRELPVLGPVGFVIPEETVL